MRCVSRVDAAGPFTGLISLKCFGYDPGPDGGQHAHHTVCDHTTNQRMCIVVSTHTGGFWTKAGRLLVDVAHHIVLCELALVCGQGRGEGEREWEPAGQTRKQPRPGSETT